jgi:hypothetical protein
MKFKEDRPLGNPEAALAKLLEIANALEADHAGRISVGAINHAFLEVGGNVAEYGAAMHRAVADGWMEAHPSERNRLRAASSFSRNACVHTASRPDAPQ